MDPKNLKKEKSPVEQIADNLVNLTSAVEALLKGPLNRKALLTLLAASSKLNRSTIDQVLTSIQNLRKDFLH